MKKNWKKPKAKKPKPREVSIEPLHQILEQAAHGALGQEALQTLAQAVDTLALLQQAIQEKSASIARLRHLLFGPSTEKTSRILGKDGQTVQAPALPAQALEVPASSPAPAGSSSTAAAERTSKPKPKGHGRNGAEDYVGAYKVEVPHQKFHHKDRCPGCESGKLYIQQEPSQLLRIVGMAPLSATVYELERLRCNLCGEVFTAASPPGVGDAKYDESAPAMLGMLKYGCGFPFNRLEWLERQLGIPLPQTTQWEAGARCCRAARLRARRAHRPGRAGRGSAQRRHDDEDPAADPGRQGA